MGDFCLLAASLLVQGSNADAQLPPSKEPPAVHAEEEPTCQPSPDPQAIAHAETHLPEFSPADAAPFIVPTEIAEPEVLPSPPPPTQLERSQPEPQPHLEQSWLPPPATPAVRLPSPQPVLTTPRPVSGSQLYQQRWVALRAGRTYTRLPANSFQADWINATQQPTYEQWVQLLAQEARGMARGQGSNQLTVLLGDSLSLWFPPERMTGDRFWLNQGISGDTTAGVLRRLSALDNTRPTVVHVMVGINDLRRGATDGEVLGNLRQIMRQLRQRHPQAEVVVHSILPTRLSEISGDRIRQLNQNLAAIAQQENVAFLNVAADFSDAQGNLRQDLTTDGLHLNPSGYALWQLALR